MTDDAAERDVGFGGYGHRHEPRDKGGERMDEEQDHQTIGMAREAVVERASVSSAFQIAKALFDLHAFGIDVHDLLRRHRGESRRRD